jgi:hypothetical protein
VRGQQSGRRRRRGRRGGELLRAEQGAADDIARDLQAIPAGVNRAVSGGLVPQFVTHRWRER